VAVVVLLAVLLQACLTATVAEVVLLQVLLQACLTAAVVVCVYLTRCQAGPLG